MDAENSSLHWASYIRVGQVLVSAVVGQLDSRIKTQFYIIIN